MKNKVFYRNAKQELVGKNACRMNAIFSVSKIKKTISSVFTIFQQTLVFLPKNRHDVGFSTL
jgi:hypothetical protein